MGNESFHSITLGQKISASLQHLILVLLAVCLAIEVAEKIQEDHAVSDEEECQGSWEFAVHGDDGDQVEQHKTELDELDPCHVLLPPQVLLVFGSHGGQHVVEVHDYVHEGVEETNNNALFTWNIQRLIRVLVYFGGAFHSPGKYFKYPHEKRAVTV